MDESKAESDARREAGVGRGDETQLYHAADAVVRVLDEYLAALKAGRAPSREDLLAQHPALAPQLEACLAGLDFIHQAQANTHPQQKIGDFQIVREVGRGGMGAVYEAIQTSLGRRVALKILRFSPTSDKEAVERFQREAETVATLHHTNIVPIFFVGSEHAVNYYAMQFIEGRDLAQLIADRDAVIPPVQVAAWGLQAAEALAHAHRRGVVHRDVKPSNLILDKEERLWLTDFGLARRLDDVTLSLTGMLLGTPRYMSPEHARASTKRIDRRSDLFSLGATLYELLTRTPAFPGDAPHDVIQHILADDPTPIRHLNPAVPRDLETVVMKCMAKEPGSRYQAADELAADLRAVLDDRPIRARRASRMERATRWLKHNQRSVSQVSTAAMVTLAITLTTLLAWTSYTSWNMSGIRLGAVNPPLVAEIFNAEGTLVRTESLPMQEAASLPAGQYAVRVSAEGTLSQTFAVSLDRGRRDAKYTVNVADQWLVSHKPLVHSYDVFDTGKEQAIIQWGKDGLAVQQLHGPPSSWSLTLSPQTTSALAGYPGYANPRPASDVLEQAFGAGNESRPWVIHELLDVNGDGVGDIVCAARHQAWMMAISGTGSEVLWFAGRGRELATANASQPHSSGNSLAQSSVVYPPLVCGDIDGDLVRDFVVTVAEFDAEAPGQPSTLPCTRSVEAISSRSGQSLWRYELPDEVFALAQGEQVPYDLRWFHHLRRGRMSQGGNTMWLGQHHLRSPPRLEQTGPHAYLPLAPQLLTVQDQPIVAVAAGNRLLMLDAKSGQPRPEPLELPFRPAKVARWADVDGDGGQDMIALEESHAGPGAASSIAPNAGASAAADPTLVVWSLAKRKQLWSRQLDAYWPSKRGWSLAAPQWPLVTDLDSDGTFEIIVPDGRSHRSNSFTGGNASRKVPWGSLGVYDGGTGSRHWTRSIVTLDAEVEYIDGPDVDGDGTRDLFAASCEPKGEHLYVDALSGATGKSLWSAKTPVPGESQFNRFRVTALQWWQSGNDGWPQIVISVTDNAYYSENVLNTDVFVFSAGTGQCVSVGSEITEVFPVDLDRDGAEDLIVCSNEAHEQGARGSLHCVRGTGRQTWKNVAALGEPLVDLDRDGVSDFVRSWGDGTLLATSGANGQELWRSRVIRTVSELGVYALQTSSPGSSQPGSGQSLGDVNADGFDDLIVFESYVSGRKKSPLHAISGRSGGLLWTMDEVSIQTLRGTLATKIVDLDQDGTAEVLWLSAVDYGYPEQSHAFSSSDVQLWLFAASAKTGRLRWAQPLSPAYRTAAGVPLPLSPLRFDTVAIDLMTADINGDGVLDVAVPAIDGDGGFETRVLEGKQGRLLWSRSRPSDGLGQQSLENWTSPTVCDFGGDGKPELALVEPFVADATQNATKVEVAVTVVDATGQVVWSKPTGSAFTHFHSYSHRKGELLRPIAIGTTQSSIDRMQRSDDHAGPVLRPTSRIVVVLPSDPKIVSLDASGESLERTLGQSADLSTVLSYDIDRDGQEELLLVDRGALYATRADDLEAVLWQHKLGELGQQQILQVLPASATFPPLALARTDVTSNLVVALDVRSGQRVWTCPGPIARGFDSGAYYVQTRAEILGGAATAPPLVHFQYEMVNDCRQGLLAASQVQVGRNDAGQSEAGASEAGMDVWSQWAARSASHVPAVVSGVTDDARWKRPLPWAAQFSRDPRLIYFFLWGTFFAITLVVIPVGYIGWLAIKRRFQTRHLLLLPVVAAIVLQAVLITAPDEDDFSTFATRLSIGLAFTPPIFALFAAGRWAALRRWRRIVIWLSVTLATSVAIAIISLNIAMRSAPLIDNEHFDVAGWYLIVLPAAYLTSWLIMLSVPLETFARWIFKRKWSRGQKTQPPQPSSAVAPSKALPAAGVPTASAPAAD